MVGILGHIGIVDEQEHSPTSPATDGVRAVSPTQETLDALPSIEEVTAEDGADENTTARTLRDVRNIVSGRRVRYESEGGHITTVTSASPGEAPPPPNWLPGRHIPVPEVLQPPVVIDLVTAPVQNGRVVEVDTTYQVLQTIPPIVQQHHLEPPRTHDFDQHNLEVAEMYAAHARSEASGDRRRAGQDLVDDDDRIVREPFTIFQAGAEAVVGRPGALDLNADELQQLIAQTAELQVSRD